MDVSAAILAQKARDDTFDDTESIERKPKLGTGVPETDQGRGEDDLQEFNLNEVSHAYLFAK